MTGPASARRSGSRLALVLPAIAIALGGLTAAHAFEAIARVSNVDAGGVERADVHALTLRLRG